MNFRRMLFWTHLTAGSVAGVVILIMSFTGVMLAYERQITVWVNRGYRSTPPEAGAATIPVGTLLSRACAGQPSAPTNVLVHSRGDLPVEIGFGAERTVYFNSYTGVPIGAASQHARNFFRIVENWHRWLGVSAVHRATGRTVTGICNLALLVLVGTGICLWWPRSLSWQRIGNAITWRRNHSSTRARNWNWHTVTGFWCAIPLLLIVVCGVVMSFPWANNLLYRVTQSPLPIPDGAVSQPVDSSSTRALRNRRPRAVSAFATGLRGEGDRVSTSAGNKRQASGSGCNDWDVAGVNRSWERAEQQAPGWHTISLRVPPNPQAPAVFTIDESDGGHPDKRSQLTLNWQTGDLVRWEPFSSYSPGRRLRAWVRFSHTGEAGGVPGETIAALAATGACVLVMTGLAMAWRRLRARFVVDSQPRSMTRGRTLFVVEAVPTHEVIEK